MANSKAGYGAVPPPLYTGGAIAGGTVRGVIGGNGQFLTANGANGTNWLAPQPATNAIQIGGPDPVITFKLDGDIVTQAGTITADDWVTTVKIMKKLIMDMSQDEELASKYPYIRDAAHSWMMEELKK